MESREAVLGAPTPAAVASEQTQKFSLFALTMMVVGSMVGAGIFSLPRPVATATGADGRQSCRRFFCWRRAQLVERLRGRPYPVAHRLGLQDGVALLDNGVVIAES